VQTRILEQKNKISSGKSKPGRDLVHALSVLHGQTQERGSDGQQKSSPGQKDSLQNLQRYEGQAERQHVAPKRRKKIWRENQAAGAARSHD
jgi:hypothetical protein